MHNIETRVFITLLIGAVVLALILVFFVLTILKHQKRSIIFEKEILLKDIQLLETERSRIAADLHDELGSLISAIKINLECIQSINNPDDNTIMQKVGSYIDTTMQKIREISNNLMPQSLEQNGILIAVKEFIEMIDTKNKFSILYKCDIANDVIIEPNKQIHIYRIVQEIINNTIKHGNATLINVRFYKRKHLLCLALTDNGIGFDKEKASAKKGSTGLRNIVQRVELIEGKIYLESVANKGTHYLIEMPIE